MDNNINYDNIQLVIIRFYVMEYCINYISYNMLIFINFYVNYVN